MYHILILPSLYPHAGKPWEGAFVRDQARALCRAGFRADVAFVEPRRLHTLRPQRLKESYFQTVSAIEDGVFTLRQKGWNPVLNSSAGGVVWAALMRRLISRYIAKFGRPDLMHAHNSIWAGHAATRIARKRGIPLIITEHDSAFLMRAVRPELGPHVRQVYQGADQIIAVSRPLAAAMREYTNGKTAVVVPNVVDTNFFVPPSRPRCTSPFVFLAIGNLIKLKAFDTLLRAFAARFREQPETQLHIAGGGPERQTLQALSRSLGIGRSVHFLGQLSREQVREAMWKANAFVHSSRHETFGIVLIEALAAGLPVIATQCGGPEDFVTPQVGHLVPPDDERCLGDAMEQLRRSSEFQPAVLHHYAAARFGEKVFTARLAQLYAGVLGKTAGQQLTGDVR